MQSLQKYHYEQELSISMNDRGVGPGGARGDGGGRGENGSEQQELIKLGMCRPKWR